MKFNLWPVTLTCHTGGAVLDFRCPKSIANDPNQARPTRPVFAGCDQVRTGPVAKTDNFYRSKQPPVRWGIFTHSVGAFEPLSRFHHTRTWNPEKVARDIFLLWPHKLRHGYVAAKDKPRSSWHRPCSLERDT